MNNRWALLALPLLAVAVGCGDSADVPELGEVTGTVTMDGQPVPNAVLTFQPEHARPSYGRTNEEGQYELIYTDDNPGATIGKHTVRITTAAEGDPDQGQEAQKETIPAKYNVQTELTANVEAGDNVIDFQLESGGEIVEQDDSE